MLAEITYNTGKSYRLKKTKFFRGKTLKITDPEIIQRCQVTAGFAINMLDSEVEPEVKAAPKPKKQAVKMEVAEVEEAVEDFDFDAAIDDISDLDTEETPVSKKRGRKKGK